jgi:hypothetical protein
MKPIPISAAAKIAKAHGYDQVVIVARKVGEPPAPHGESCTTYGVSPAHCEVAALMGDVLKYNVMEWTRDLESESPTQEQIDGVAAVFAECADDPIARSSAIILAKKLRRVFLPVAKNNR